MAVSTFHNAATATGRGTVFPCENFNTMTFEVSGTATSFTLVPEGISFSSTPVALFVTNLNTGAGTASITANGLYRVTVTALLGVNMNLTAVTGGNVTVSAKIL